MLGLAPYWTTPFGAFWQTAKQRSVSTGLSHMIILAPQTELELLGMRKAMITDDFNFCFNAM